MTNPVRQVANQGYLGVQIFFVISGFVIPWSLYNSSYRIKNFFSYLFKRCIRIQPPYIISIILLLVLNYISSKSPNYIGLPFHFDIKQFLLHLVFLPEYFGTTWYQPVYFTLLVEFEFYILLGLIFPLLVSGKKWIVYTLPLILLSGYYFIPADLFKVIDLFLIGMIYFKFRAGQLTKVEFWLMEVAVILFTAISNLDINVVIIEVLAVIGILYWNHSNVVTRFLAGISYSLYLLHIPIGGRFINLSERYTHTIGMTYVSLLLSIIISIVGAWIFYKLAELPAMKLSRKLFSRF